MKKILCVSLAILMMHCVSAQKKEQPDLGFPKDPNVRIGKLANGITYYVRKNAKPENRAELKLVVNAGSTQENDDQQGLAHFTEHMAFNGTKTFPGNKMIEYLESNGIKFGQQLNAYTSFDETVYMLNIQTDSEKVFNMGIQILVDWAHNLAFDDTEIDKERGVITEEWRLGQGADERMRKQYWPVLFKNSQYANRIPIGKKEVIENFKHETIRNFYKDWYRPDLMAVVAVGDFDPNKVEELIKQKFSSIPKAINPKPLKTFEIPDHKETLISKVTDKEAVYTDIELYYKHPAEKELNIMDYRRKLVYNLYNSMLNKRLQELQKQANPPFLFSYSNFGDLLRTKSAYTSVAYVQEKGIERGLETIATENERVKRFGFTQSELDRTKKEMLRGIESQYKERNKTESDSYANEYIRNFLMGEPAPGIEFEYQLYNKFIPTIKLEEINVLPKKWITEGENCVVIITAPQKEGVELPSDAKILDILKNVRNDKNIKPYEDKVSERPLLDKKPSGTKIVEEKFEKEVGIYRLKLANGVKVVLKPTDFKNDQILFAASSPGGYSVYPENLHMTCTNAATIVDKSGLNGFSDIELGKVLSGKIVNITPYISEIMEGLNGSVAPEDMETLFQLIYMYFTKTRKDSIAFLSYMDQQKGLIQNRSAEPSSAYYDTIQVTMSNHNYRYRPLTMDLLKEIDMNKAYDIYKDRFADAGDFTFYFVGSFSIDRIKPFIETYLGGLPSINRKESWKDIGVRPPTGKIEKIVKKGTEPKSSVQLKFTGPFDWSRKNRLDMYSLLSALNIKLRESLREDKGGTYGVGAWAYPRHYPVSRYEITIGWGCNPANVDELIKAAIAEIDKIKQNGITEDELTKIKEMSLRERETALKENNWWLSAITSNDQNNENILELLDYNNYVKNLKIDDFKNLANKYFNMNNYAKFVLLPEKN